MPSLKDLRNRIASVKATQKITKAMQMVAAAKLRRAQAAAEAARPYALRMNAVLANLAESVMGSPAAPRLLAGTGSDKVHLLIVCTAERGLCGAFNSSIARLARDKANSLLAEGKTVKIITVGRKGAVYLKREFASRIVAEISFANKKRIGFEDASEVSAKISEMLDAGEFDVCTLIYNRFKNVISQTPVGQQLIPAPLPEVSAESGVQYEFEPTEEEILARLLPQNLGIQIYRALLDNAAGFYGSQMTAMDNATRNAGEMINKLTLNYNRTRQANITRELIEIISGAEAL